MLDPEELLKKYKRGECTPEELLILQKWFHELDNDQPSQLDEFDLEEALLAFEHNHNRSSKNIRPIVWVRALQVAALLLIAGIGIYFISQPGIRNEATVVAAKPSADLTPGGNKATLTLSDGRKVVLSDARDGHVLSDAGITITKTADGQLTYTVTEDPGSASRNAFNTIETPAGGQYHVRLPDGSEVWLNTLSSLRYPVPFDAIERRVEITGEAYFEVAKDHERPFRVVSNGQTVEVLGTIFNVMSYKNEASINTTLVEGSVKVLKGGRSKLIKPGQQARNTGSELEVVEVNTEDVIGWKEGYFVFRNEELSTIMRQLARWYNAEVDYQGDVTGKVFGGKILRSRNISEILKTIELTGSVKFKIIPGDSSGKGRRIVVMP